MNKFRFETEVELDIEGIKCSVDLSDPTIYNAIVEYVGFTMLMVKQDKEISIKTFNEKSEKFLNDVLGKEVVAAIFNDKIIDNCDLSGLCSYILREIESFKKEKYKRYV